MRMTQFIGHTDKVLEALQKMTEVGSVGDVVDLGGKVIYTMKKHLDEKGNLWREFIQYEIWSGGPMIFLGIKNEATGEVLGWDKVDRGIGEYVDPKKGEMFV